MVTGNSEAIDLICRRYPGCGSPTLYLRRIESIEDISKDYAMARFHRQRDMDFVTEWIDEIYRKLGPTPDVHAVIAEVLKCLAQIMSSK